VRESLSHNQRRSGDRVFSELHRRLERAIEQGRSVVLDSTGMSPRFRALLRAHRENVVHVHLTLGSQQCFEERERQRTDRPGGMLSASAFHDSQRIEFHDPPDVAIATDDLTPDEVFGIALRSLSS
ncbi:MAG TPA: hypothetical protein VFH72_14255, partial [Candidatus Baltobacteraceae bacterium]|nr:hypothetical protein [Candidatus Baltobacteraceae bacterium]